MPRNGQDQSVIQQLIQSHGGGREFQNADLVEEIIGTALRLVDDKTDRLDTKLITSTLKELRYASKIFAPFRGKRKVTVFGSARVPPGDPYYKITVELARGLAKHNLAIITGGGPGIMEAANKGAALARGKSIGLNIELPQEQKGNRYANIPIHFHYFFSRKVCFAKYSVAFVFMPGGFGTLDEFFEVLTLVQTRRIPEFPLILFGREHWSGLLKWMRSRMLGRAKFISPGDLDLVTLTDDPQEAIDVILDYERRVGPPEMVPKAFA